MALISVDWRPSQKTLGQFGLVCAVAFTLLGLWVRFRGGLFGFHFPAAANTVSTTLWIVAAISGVLSRIAPLWLRPLYLGLTLITLPIGFVVSHVLMGLLFYGVLTPIALIFRVIGRDSMNRRLEPQRESYWISRPPVKEVSRYFRQF